MKSIDQDTQSRLGCVEWRDYITTLLELPPDDDIRQTWTAHAVKCKACRIALADDGEARRLMGLLPAPRPASIAPFVMSRVRASDARLRMPRIRDLAWGIGGAAAGAAIGLLIAASTPSFNVQTEKLAAYEAIIIEMNDTIETVITELAMDVRESSK